MNALRKLLADACEFRDRPWALATLVRTTGSTYRKPGAWLLIGPDGKFTGVLSGGCLEEDIARHGVEVIQSGIPRLVDYDTRKLYGCDGQLEIFIEKIPAAGVNGNFLTAVAEKLARRELCRTRVHFAQDAGCSELLPDHALVAEQPDAFVQSIPLPVRLLLFGTGPEVPPMRFFAAGMGWIVREYAHPSELPGDFTADEQTAAVVMTHQFGRDLAALDRLLPLGLPYLGLLGPQRRHAELLRRFQEYRELEPAWLKSLHAPAGLDIGSEAPEEIALSIVAEASAVLARREGGFLRERTAPIHVTERIEREA